jgi:hypothetical protein
VDSTWSSVRGRLLAQQGPARHAAAQFEEQNQPASCCERGQRRGSPRGAGRGTTFAGCCSPSDSGSIGGLESLTCPPTHTLGCFRLVVCMIALGRVPGGWDLRTACRLDSPVAQSKWVGHQRALAELGLLRTANCQSPEANSSGWRVRCGGAAVSTERFKLVDVVEASQCREWRQETQAQRAQDTRRHP